MKRQRTKIPARPLAQGVASVALFMAACTGGESSSSRVFESPLRMTNAQVMPESARAVLAVRRLRAQFQTALPSESLKSHRGHSADVVGPVPIASQPLIPDPVVEKFVTDGLWIRARLRPSAWRGVSDRARVHLPVKAAGAFRLQDAASGMAIMVSLQGASANVPGQAANGYLLYANAAPGGGHLLYRVHARGTEDYVTFEAAPPRAEIRYLVALDGEIAGLRLVANVLEFIDHHGVPRLRMKPPFLVDARGTRHDALGGVHGCVYDGDPRAPWGRPPVPTGAAHCHINVSWSDRGPIYPVAVDPGWETTGDMTHVRYLHTANELSNAALPYYGNVLVAGGYNNEPIGSAELYDPLSGQWAATDDLDTIRAYHKASVLANGKLLVVGGKNAQGDSLNSAELYDPESGKWAPTPNQMSAHRIHPTVTVLASGKVLVAGGEGVAGITHSDSELYDPNTGQWTPTGTMTVPRQQHAATLLSDGRVLVTGGVSIDPPYTAELYDPTTGQWSSTGDMTGSRYFHTSTLLNDGRVLVVGGSSSGPTTATAELYDPNTESWTPTAQTMAHPRSEHTASKLGGGTVLVAGGSGSPSGEASSELYNPAIDAWLDAGDLDVPRAQHAATVLRQTSGKVLVSGGTGLFSAELFDTIKGNGTCYVPGECDTGHCVDGFCCDQICNHPCMACSATLKGGGLDGICGPIPTSTDPKNGCLDSGSPTCADNGLCDGQGACQKYPVSSGCTPTPCTEQSECAEPLNCADNICCDQPCDGVCEACTAAKKGSGVDGLCQKLLDRDPDDECPADPGYPTSCLNDGMCNGEGKCREFAKPGTECGSVACNGSWLTRDLCTVEATCIEMSTDCFPYDCENGSCLEHCAASSDCAADAWCDQGTCRPQKAAGDSCTTAENCKTDICLEGVCCTVTDCSPFRCGPAGVCLIGCESTADCTWGYTCNSSGQCVAAAHGTPPTTCRVHHVGQPNKFPRWLTLGLLLWLAARLRKPCGHPIHQRMRRCIPSR